MVPEESDPVTQDSILGPLIWFETPLGVKGPFVIVRLLGAVLGLVLCDSGPLCLDLQRYVLACQCGATLCEDSDALLKASVDRGVSSLYFHSFVACQVYFSGVDSFNRSSQEKTSCENWTHASSTQQTLNFGANHNFSGAFPSKGPERETPKYRTLNTKTLNLDGPSKQSL